MGVAGVIQRLFGYPTDDHNGVEHRPAEQDPEAASPAGALINFLAISFIPVGPLGIFSKWVGKKEDAQPAEETPPFSSTPPPPAADPLAPNPSAVWEQYRAAYEEQLQKLGVKKAEDIDVLLSYFAQWGINHWSTLSESRRGSLTQTGELPQEIVGLAQTGLIKDIEPDSNRETFSRQQIERLLTRARVFAWVEKNSAGVARDGFASIRSRAIDIIKVWKDVDIKVKNERFGYRHGPIPDSFIEYVNKKAELGVSLVLLPAGDLAPRRSYSASQTPAAASPAAPIVSTTAAASPTRPREVLSTARAEAQAGTRSPEPARSIMNLEAFEVAPYAFYTKDVEDHLRKMTGFRGSSDAYVTTIAQAVVFLWNMALMAARPNTLLRHMSTQDRTPTDQFIDERAMALHSEFESEHSISEDAEGLRRRVREDYMLFYEPDRQMADYVSEIAVSAFESSFFDKKTGRFNLDGIFIQLFVKRFALWKVNEVARVWDDMPDELREAFGRKAPGEIYPALFMEFMLSAKNGLSIDYILERNERPVRVRYGTHDDRSTIERQVHEELATRYPGLLYYGNLFGQLVHHLTWQRRETASASPAGPRAEKSAPAPEQNEFAELLSQLPLITAIPDILSRLAVDTYMIGSTATHLQTITGFRNKSMTELKNLARIIAARWMTSQERAGKPASTIDPPDLAFIEEQAALLQNRKILSTYDLLSMKKQTFNIEQLKATVRELAGKRGIDSLDVDHLAMLSVFAFSDSSYTGQRNFNVPSIYLDIFANDLARPIIAELHSVETTPLFSLSSLLMQLERERLLHHSAPVASPVPSVMPARTESHDGERGDEDMSLTELDSLVNPLSMREPSLPRRSTRRRAPAHRVSAPAPVAVRPAPQPVVAKYNIFPLHIFDHLHADSRFITSITLYPTLRAADPSVRLTMARAILLLWRFRLMLERPSIKLDHRSNFELSPSYDFIEREAQRLLERREVIAREPINNVSLFSRLMNEALTRTYGNSVQFRDYLARLALDGFERSFFGSMSYGLPPDATSLPPVLIDLFVERFAPIKIAELEDAWKMMPFDLQKAFGLPKHGEQYPPLFIDFMLSLRYGGDINFYLKRSERPYQIERAGQTTDSSRLARIDVENGLAKSNPWLLLYYDIFSQLAFFLTGERRQKESVADPAAAPARTAAPAEAAAPEAPRQSGSLFVDGVEIKPTQRATDAAQVTELLVDTDTQTTPDAQKLQELVLSSIAKFADKVGGLIPDFALANSIMNEAAHSRSHQLFEDGRNFLKLSGHARHYYIHLAIEEYAREVQAAFDAGKPPIWFANFIEQIFRHRHRMNDIKEFEQQAAKFRFQKQDKAVENVFGVPQAVRDQIAGGVSVTDRQYFTVLYLAGAAILAWEVIGPAQRSWFVSQAIPELVAKRGELPPAFIRWFSRHIAPELLKGGASGGGTPSSGTAGGQGANNDFGGGSGSVVFSTTSWPIWDTSAQYYGATEIADADSAVEEITAADDPAAEYEDWETDAIGEGFDVYMDMDDMAVPPLYADTMGQALAAL